jgi:hypothetical protein
MEWVLCLLEIYNLSYSSHLVLKNILLFGQYLIKIYYEKYFQNHDLDLQM